MVDIHNPNIVGGLTTDVISLNDSPADGEASGYVVEINVTEITGVGAPISMNSSGEYVSASADSTGSPCIALSVDGQTGNSSVLKFGYMRNNSWSFSNLGQPVYLSTTPGSLTQTAPSGSGDVVQVVGIATASNIILFNPNYALATVA